MESRLCCVCAHTQRKARKQGSLLSLAKKKGGEKRKKGCRRQKSVIELKPRVEQLSHRVPVVGEGDYIKKKKAHKSTVVFVLVWSGWACSLSLSPL